MAGHDFICDRCGFRYPASKAREEWTNWLVCPDCYEPKHPQLGIKSFADKQAVDNPRPPQPIRFRRLDDNRISRPRTERGLPIKPYNPEGG